MFPRDWVMLAHFHGSLAKTKCTLVAVAHEKVKSFEIQGSILIIFAVGIGPQIGSKSIFTELSIEV